MIIFTHQVKTAGLNILYVFRNNFLGTHVLIYPLEGKVDSQNKAIVSDKDINDFLQVNNHLKCIVGHGLRISNGKYKTIKEAKYFSFFRNPIDRYLSMYQGWLNKHEKNETIERRINDPEENNYMVRFIAGSEDLDKAIKIVKNDLDFVGIVEEFDKSLIMMKQYLSLGKAFDIRYELKNMAGKLPGRNYLETKYSYLNTGNSLEG